MIYILTNTLIGFGSLSSIKWGKTQRIKKDNDKYNENELEDINELEI